MKILLFIIVLAMFLKPKEIFEFSVEISKMGDITVVTCFITTPWSWLAQYSDGQVQVKVSLLVAN